MRLRGVRRSRNIEDRRGRGGTARAGGMGLVGVLAVLAIGYFTGVDISPLLSGGGGQMTRSEPRALTQEEQQWGDWAAGVLGTTEDVWGQVFQQQLGKRYTPSQLVLFSGTTQSPCGGASGATGPFYCPADRKAYLDTDFFTTLARRMGAGGDFAAAYVIAHEVAHHVQDEVGTLARVHQARQRMSERDSNAVTVRLELQADCYAGIWARNVEGLLEPGDIEEAVNAAHMIGDDRLQRQAGRVPQPHTFTHGTSEQRARWFATGYESGQMQSCDTFNARAL